jgi:hypothetical protein
MKPYGCGNALLLILSRRRKRKAYMLCPALKEYDNKT